MAARSLGVQFASTQFWLPPDGDFADVAAARWEGGRLALEDLTGRELAVTNIVVLEGLPASPDDGSVRVVADFRSDRARARHVSGQRVPATGAARGAQPDPGRTVVVALVATLRFR